MSVIKGCNAAGQSIKNTGSQCDKMLGQVAMVLFGSTSITIPKATVEAGDGTLITYLQGRINSVGATRIFPYGGNNQPFTDTVDQKGNAVTYTSPITQAKIQLIPAALNLTLSTLNGGLCLGQALLTIGKSNLGVILVDNEGGILLKHNSDGSYGFFNSYNSPGALQLQLGATPFQNSVNLSMNTETMTLNGSFWVDTTGSILDLMGLTDVQVDSRAAATSTTVTVGGTYECGGGDIYDIYGSALAVSAVWRIIKADGTLLAITGVTASPSLKAYVLTFATQASALPVTVDLETADVLYTNTVPGIESTGGVTITIP